MGSRARTVGRRGLVGFGLVCGFVVCSDEPSVGGGEGHRLFELRHYTTKPGKLEALHERFRRHTIALFEEHGIEVVGYWTPVEGEGVGNTLIYIAAYPSREAREESWKRLLADPRMLEVIRGSTTEGRLVEKVEETFLVPTDYSPMR